MMFCQPRPWHRLLTLLSTRNLFKSQRSSAANVMRMIEVAISDAHRNRAAEVIQGLPVWQGSHRGYAANQVGVLGEVVVREYLQQHGLVVSPVFSTSHDLELPNGKRIEVKTKDRTVPPRPDYECSIPLYNESHQAVDYYIFASLQRMRSRTDEDLDRFTSAHLVGAANRRMVEEQGVVRQTGEVDPRNGTRFWTACRNLYIRDLRDLAWAVEQWKSQGT